MFQIFLLLIYQINKNVGSNKARSSSSEDGGFRFLCPWDDFRTRSSRLRCLRHPFQWFPLRRSYRRPTGRMRCSATDRRACPWGGIWKSSSYRHFCFNICKLKKSWCIEIPLYEWVLICFFYNYKWFLILFLFC